MKPTFTPLWRSVNGFHVRSASDHILLFAFDNKEDVERILANELWSFDKHLVVLQRYEKNTPLRELKFDQVAV